ncbi:MAG: hypothetical protein SVY10_09285 [Thermodesulfobacteriota bacterium]|nr:hypothetical protein [Thermodesulfobacteriota bacterium]
MSNILPEGENIRRAVKWISEHLEENPDEIINKLINEATIRFDLSPKDGEFLIRFYRNKNGSEK